jgi:hypothetical protein
VGQQSGGGAAHLFVETGGFAPSEPRASWTLVRALTFLYVFGLQNLPLLGDANLCPTRPSWFTFFSSSIEHEIELMRPRHRSVCVGRLAGWLACVLGRLETLAPETDSQPADTFVLARPKVSTKHMGAARRQLCIRSRRRSHLNLNAPAENDRDRLMVVTHLAAGLARAAPAS